MGRTTPFTRWRCALVAAAALLSGPTRTAPAQNATSSPAPETLLAVAPTVTAQMGDVGGKYFGKTPDPAKSRHYYIAAEPELWNFAPQGQDPVCGRALPSKLLLNRSSWKIRYVQYADENFTARVLPTERLGILGPVLRGVQGQYIEVTFLNRAWRPLSMHPHGLKYDKDSEGSYYNPARGRGAAVEPGAKFTYVWYLDEESAPRPDEPSSKAWLYHSHVTGDEETNLGLIGFIVVTDPKRARPDGTPQDVDREMAALFTIFNESNLGNEDIGDPDDRAPGEPVGPRQYSWAEKQQASDEGQRHTINGRTFGNLAGLEMNQGERVRWYLFGMGSEEDFHTAHWHGLRILEDGHRQTDVVELLPASMRVADMKVDNPGMWLFHCHVAEHMSRGMFARMTVHPAGKEGVSRDPEVAFFGMPQSLATLRFSEATLTPQANEHSPFEVNLVGQVTVPTPFPAAENDFVLQIGNKRVSLRPDASGLSVAPDAILLVKNTSLSGNGIVTGGTLQFEITLKGDPWLAELRRLHLMHGNLLGPNPRLPVTLQVGPAQHTAIAILKNEAAR